MPRNLYRPDIDGLRALAVLAVIFSHSGFSWASGGYVGVDVFFVISGFLITRLIHRELKESRFSFSGFYMRRIRRLMPALCFTLVVSLVAGCILSHPIRLESLGWSTIWTVIPAANIHFWTVSGYFTPAADTKPLLHTWSLAVEEQFYFVWPALMVFLLTKTSQKATLLVIGVVGLISWVAAELLITNSPTLAFYWMPFRICEFAVGALLVWSEDWEPQRCWQELGYVLGLATICGCCVLYDNQTRFPGSHAMLSALGAGLLIQFGRAPLSSLLLNNRVARGIGLISYSAYLAHWPLLVFFHGQHAGHLDGWWQWMLTPTALLIGWGMYAAVEQPFRRPRAPGENKGFLVSLGLAMSVAVVGGLALYINDGWPQRPTYANPPYAQVDTLADKRKRVERNQGRCRDPKWTRIGCPDADRRVGLVVGNSHASDGDVIMAAATGSTDRLILSGKGNCPPIHPSKAKRLLNRNMPNFERCEQMNEERWTPEYYDGVDYVVVSTTYRKGGFSPDRLREYMDFLHGLDIWKIIVFGQFIRLREDLLIALPRSKSLRDLVREYSRRNFAYNGELSRICKEKGCLFVDKKKLLCNETGCILQAKGIPFTWDRGHLTLQFATLVGHRARPQILRYLNKP